jgi:hypothetical protein
MMENKREKPEQVEDEMVEELIEDLEVPAESAEGVAGGHQPECHSMTELP